MGEDPARVLLTSRPSFSQLGDFVMTDLLAYGAPPVIARLEIFRTIPADTKVLAVMG
jgi:hypothetical protein